MNPQDEIRDKMISARLRDGLTQRDMAKLMCTGQATIARLEVGKRYPSLTTLEKWAEVTGHKLEVRFVPR